MHLRLPHQFKSALTALAITGLFITFATPASAINSDTVLNNSSCNIAVDNIHKGIKSLKRHLRRKTTTNVDQITRNVINAKLAQLKSKTSIEACLASAQDSKSIEAKGYRCMIETTDLQQCMVNQ